MHLAGGETKEVWRCLKGWYRAASERAPAASHALLAIQTVKRAALYGKVPPPVANVPIHVNKVNVPDGVPSDQELLEVVRGRGGGEKAETRNQQRTSGVCTTRTRTGLRAHENAPVIR